MSASNRRFPFALLVSWLSLAVVSLRAGQTDSSPPAPIGQHAGAITGYVSNSATRNFLEGAKVELPQLGLVALTDNTGRFSLKAVPAGTYELVASYLGLDPARSTVTVGADQVARRDFDLNTAIYLMSEFTVTGEREGAAAAITAQRNAANVKNVVSTDSFGNLPNMTGTELALRLPGVAGNFSPDDVVAQLSIRGMGPGLNVITVDGGLVTSEGALNRNVRAYNLTTAMFDQVELVKGHTPDKGADSLGGTLNFKTRSPLSMKEKRRVSYNFSGRLAPSFTEQDPLREQHRFHPQLNLGWQEVFGAFGGERNLGVALNLYYFENVSGTFTTTRDFQNTTTPPAYVWDYRTSDAYNNRFQTSASLKVEYRLSPTTKVLLNSLFGNDINNYTRSYEVRAFTGQTVGTTGTAGILPGYTDRVTQVRASTASNIDMTSTGPNNFYQRRRQGEIGAEHEFGRLQLDYNLYYTQSNRNEGSGQGGTLVNRISNIAWTLDRSASDLYPKFIQTAGADFTNPENYRPNGFLQHNDRSTDYSVRDVRGNARYELTAKYSLFVKTGFQWRQQVIDQEANLFRWSYLGTTALPHDPAFITFDSRKTGRRMPVWDAAMIINHHKPLTPALWREDVYYHEQNIYTGDRDATETSTAGYVMMQGKVGRTGFLAGVRSEKTDTEGAGFVRARVPSTTAQQAADPVGSAKRDYADTYRVTTGSYSQPFPSAHLTQDVTRNLKARLSWSTSFGRPNMSNFIQTETADETNRVLTVSNPSLLPQYARNWDATLDYYFEPVGSLSAGWFHKTIKDFIVTGVEVGTVPSGANNGFDGQYAGFSERTSVNAGTAVVQGWEFSYQQQFSFLPGLLKGLSTSVNYTLLDTHGDFGGTSTLSSGQVAGFRPRTGNVSVFWRHKNISAQVLLNYHGSYLSTYSAASPALNLYQTKRILVDLGFAYQVRPAVSLTCNVSNIFNEPQVFYRGYADRMQRTIINGTTITLGIGGRF